MYNLSMENKMSCVNSDIFEYIDYREFLRDRYLSLKEETPRKFSFRAFSMRCGFSSPNFLKLVIDGKRNISEESAGKFANAFKLSRDETKFFKLLVKFNQAASGEDKEQFAKQIFRSRRFKNAQPLKSAQFNYYAKWYFIPIRELVASKMFKEDPHWIATQLVPHIEPQEAEQAVRELLELRLLKRDPSGKLIQTDSTIDTGDEVISTSIAGFHREMLRKASESIDRFERTEREISSATVGISKKNAERIKNLIQRFRKELLQIAGEEQEVERICQIGIQLFPLSGDLKQGDK